MTAVEWLLNELSIAGYFPYGIPPKFEDQAKEMEKEQIVTAHYQGYRSVIGTTEVSEQYYNKTFKKIK